MTAFEKPSSIVKRSFSQSIEQPRRRNWPVISPPLSAFHSQTLATNSSRVKSVRFCPWALSCRSTTICVAMPAWSVPTTHKASLPCKRAWRMRMSCRVLSSAWPMCRLPVTLGGGFTIVYGSAWGRLGRNAPVDSQCAYHFASIAAGSKVLSIVMGWCHNEPSQKGKPSRRVMLNLFQHPS